jgi:hypothetical protein
MKRTTARKTSKAKTKGSDLKDLKPARTETVTGGGKMVVNTTRYDPYKAAKFR